MPAVASPRRTGRRSGHRPAHPARCGIAAGLLAAGLAIAGPAAAQPGNPAGIDWQPVQRADGSRFEIARTEITVAQFARFVAATGHRTLAESRGGGQVYAAGWVQMPGWTWRTPFGGQKPAADDEPAVHLAFDDARAFCRWAGGRLPGDADWLRAAYTETRSDAPPPFVQGRTEPYPSGASVAGQQCLDDCGPQAAQRAIAHGAALLRGQGHARVAALPAGVNGLHGMGGNAWEWVDEPPAGTAPRSDDATERRTRGGSWWYGAAQMRAEHLASKPAATAVVYIGARCMR